MARCNLCVPYERKLRNGLWVKAMYNLNRFEAAGMANKMFPFAQRLTLHYADGFFDAAISIDMWL